MPEPTDPIEQLQSLRRGGPAVNPIPAEEVRRLGDRRRRTRRTAVSVAAAAAVVAAVVPVALIARDDATNGAPPFVGSPTPSATATTTPTSEPDVTITYPGNGIFLTDPADVIRLTGTSPEFKAFIADQVRDVIRNGSGCTDAAQGITVTKYASAGYATGGVNDCGGYATLWALKDSTWELGMGTQDIWDCDILRYYDIPRSFVDGCANESGAFGPESVSDLTLGMAEKDVRAAGGRVTDSLGGEACTGILLPYQQLIEGRTDGTFSPSRGVISLSARPGMKTPERVGFGTSVDAMKAAYPDAKLTEEDLWTVRLAADREYLFWVQDDMVTGLTLSLVDRDCLT